MVSIPEILEMHEPKLPILVPREKLNIGINEKFGNKLRHSQRRLAAREILPILSRLFDAGEREKGIAQINPP